jgi:inosose dehydratase
MESPFMTIKFGINPIGWTNDCMHWLGDSIALETCLAEARAAGFTGIELGRKMPGEPAKLRRLLGKHDLSLVSGWYSARLLERDARAEIASMKDHLRLMKECGAAVMVFAETTQEIINHVGARRSARPRIGSAAEWKKFGARISAVADHLADQGVRMAYHHHMGTVVESAEDIARLIENTGDNLGLLLDTGHLTYAGGDPVAVARKFAGRINHVHCKDIRGYALEACRRRDVSFSEAVLAGIFTAPGDGIVDYPALFKVLKRAGYRGWLVQEAEQDPRFAHPATYAQLGYAHLFKTAKAAGLKTGA